MRSLNDLTITTNHHAHHITGYDVIVALIIALLVILVVWAVQNVNSRP